MRTKNSLELFEQAVASYKLSQCLSKPDNELYNAAFYFALHRFFSGEDFPLERLYETSPEMLFEQFYLYCQKHAEVLTDAKILQRNDPAAGVLLAVVFVQEEKKSARRAACETVLKQRADVSYLKFLGGLAKTYPQLLELMFVLVESKDVWSEIYLSDLLAAYCNRPVKSTEEFAVIYKWLERLADPVAVGKHLPFAAKEIEPDNAFMAFHASHLTALLQLIAAKDGHNRILSKTVLSLITLSNLALKIRLDILNKYAARIYAGSRDNLPHFCAAVSALLKESFLTDDDVCYEILLQFEKAVPENSETALTMLQWAEQAWRSHYLLHDPQGSDFCEDGLWRFAEPVLQKGGTDDKRDGEWLSLCGELALASCGNVWCYEPLPLWLALQIYRCSATGCSAKERFLPTAKALVNKQCWELERFFEEENQIVWVEWMPALDYFWCQETAAPIKKVLQIVAYYVRDDEAAMKDWTERHGLNLKDWGCCIVYNEQREALLAALKVD